MEMKSEDLSDILEKVSGENDSIKDAVQTLHPKETKRDQFKSSDRLAIFNDTQIDASAVLEWQDRAMRMTIEEFKTLNVTEGFTEKVKALTVSKEGIGRSEIPNVMQPKILGEMLQRGLVPNQPMMPQQSGGGQSWLGRMFGRR